MKLRYIVLVVVAFLALIGVNWAIIEKEDLIATGQPIFLELAPRDPRSLIQGDYMALWYALARDLADRQDLPRGGYLVVKLDENNIVEFVRLYDGQGPLGSGERLLRYRGQGPNLRLAPESFFFEEGQAKLYTEARYAELRLDPSGEVVLVGLRGPNLEPLGTTQQFP